jgi:hypothetical protein
MATTGWPPDESGYRRTLEIGSFGAVGYVIRVMNNHQIV